VHYEIFSIENIFCCPLLLQTWHRTCKNHAGIAVLMASLLDTRPSVQYLWKYRSVSWKSQVLVSECLVSFLPPKTKLDENCDMCFTFSASVSYELNVCLNGLCLKHEFQQVFLGVTLDQTLSYRAHIFKTATKLKTRNNLISKLAGSTWGAKADTLLASSLALCYSVAEYCCPV